LRPPGLAVEITDPLGRRSDVSPNFGVEERRDIGLAA
jgi:hypothetical protein